MGAFTSSTHTVENTGHRTHVLIATLSSRIYQNAFADSRQEVVMHAYEHGFNLTHLHIVDCYVGEGRNRSAEAAITNDAEFLLFLDDDMLLPHDLVPRLVGHSNVLNADVVGCLYTNRRSPFRVVGRTLHGADIDQRVAIDLNEKQSVVEVGAVGAGAMLIRTDTLKKFEPPYFTTTPPLGEDYALCKRVLECGGRVVCDFGVSTRLHGKTFPGLGHLGVYPYSLLDALKEPIAE